MKRHALFVGVDQYADENIQDLRCAVNDAMEFAGFFKHRAHFDCAEALPNPRNCEVVLDRVQDLMSGLGAGDEFLFFFAGHGVKAQDGLRFACSGDHLADVKHGWSGIPLERLKLKTTRAFNRLFLLDACRTDVLATSRGVVGAMEKGTRDLIVGAATSAGKDLGSLTIICSCNDGECAGEVLKHRHGLFSMAMLELLDEECRCGRRVLVTDDFVYNQIPARMRALAETSGMAFNQNPQKEGPPILLLDGAVGGPVPAGMPSPASLAVASANARLASVVCPNCGAYNEITNTFKCKVCGRDHLCKEHLSREEKCCLDCVGEVKARRAADEKARLGAEEKARCAGEVRSLVLPGGVAIELVWCPATTSDEWKRISGGKDYFMMGSPTSEEGRYDDEKQHRVTLTRGFWLGKYEVTQKQWQSVMGENPSRFKGDDRPVEQVSWDNCKTFICTLNHSINCGARLPTEAEWEYACRAGTTGAYGGSGNLDEMGWYAKQVTKSRLFGLVAKVDLAETGETHPVGQKRPNAWGLYDMHGNVYEWCHDQYGDYTDDAINPMGPDSSGCNPNHVLRGGSWSTFAQGCRSADRRGNDIRYRSSIFGFRLCCSAQLHGSEVEQQKEENTIG